MFLGVCTGNMVLSLAGYPCITFFSLPGFFSALLCYFTTIIAFGGNDFPQDIASNTLKELMVAIGGMAMAGFATEPIVKKMRRKNKHYSRYQQSCFIANEYLL